MHHIKQAAAASRRGAALSIDERVGNDQALMDQFQAEYLAAEQAQDDHLAYQNNS